MRPNVTVRRPAPLPVPPGPRAAGPAAVRPAGRADLPFIDHLQRRYREQLGFLPRAALDEAVCAGRVWLALENGCPAGYLYARDRYHGRAEVGVIYQAALSYDARRRHVGTALVEGWVAAHAAGVRQVVLWCARDIEANLFWESLGFAALGYRVGGSKRGRVHVLWVRATAPDGPAGALWVPSQTSGGQMQRARAVARFAPGRGWRDV
ncbi:MAG TPA: GNAT family N-acetyltransferase [Gemmata sp.]